MVHPIRQLADEWRNRLHTEDAANRLALTRLWLAMEREIGPAIAAYVYSPGDEREQRGRDLTSRVQRNLPTVIVGARAIIERAGRTFSTYGGQAGQAFFREQGQDSPRHTAPPEWGTEWEERLEKAGDLALAALVAAMLRAGDSAAAVRMLQRELGKGLAPILMIGRDYPAHMFRASLALYEAPRWVRVSARARSTCMACILLDGTPLRAPEDLADHPHGLCFPVPIFDATWPGETGEEWFLGLEPDEQEALMGPAYYAAWLKGLFDLDDIILLTAAGYVIVRSLRSLTEGEHED